jgi:hypothetical protein
MTHSIIFDRNLFGNKINDIYYDGKNVRQITNGEAIEPDLYLNEEEIKIINQLFCLERIGFPSNKWLNIYKTLNGKKNNATSTPWIYFLKREDFKNEVQSYIHRVSSEIDKIDQEYLNQFHSYDFLFKSLQPTAIDEEQQKKYCLGTEQTQKEILKSFSPNNGYSKKPIYGRINSTTGRLIIEEGPNILILKKEYRNIITSRFGSEGKIVYLDFSSLEPRVLLSITRDCQDNDLPQDIYQHFMSTYNLDISRKIVKIALLSQLYGANEETLHKQLLGHVKKPEELIAIIKDYFGIETLKQKLKEEFNTNNGKYIKNFYGRKISCEGAKPYVLLNYYIQSTAVDVAMQGFTNIVKKIHKANYQNHIIPLFILHDGLILDIHEDFFGAIDKLCSIGSSNIKSFEKINFFLKEDNF